MLCVRHLSRISPHSSAVATYTAVINSLSKDKCDGENIAVLYLLSRGVNSHEDESGKGHDRVLERVWTLGTDVWVSILSPLPVFFKIALNTFLPLNFIFCVHIMDIIPSIFKS